MSKKNTQSICTKESEETLRAAKQVEGLLKTLGMRLIGHEDGAVSIGQSDNRPYPHVFTGVES